MRESALWLLAHQGTPESLQALKKVNTSKFSAGAQETLKALNEKQLPLEPRATPKTSRATFLKAFQDLLQGKSEAFYSLTEDVPDGERDVAAVMTPADLPLLRKVRRKLISRCNPDMLEYYGTFSDIILTVQWKAPQEKANI